MQKPSIFHNFFLLLSLFGFSLSMSSSASADDFRLISAEPMYHKVENGKGTLASSCKSLDVDAGSAVFEDPEEGERAQYNWQVPTSIPDSGAAYTIGMVVKASQNYPANGSISINSPSQVKIEGVYNLRKKADYGQEVRDTSSGRIIPALDISEITIQVRLDTLVGEFTGATYLYRRGPGPVTPPSAQPKISANLTVDPQVPSGTILQGSLSVTVEGLGSKKDEVILDAYLITSTDKDAVEDAFTKNPAGLLTKDRIKAQTTKQYPIGNETTTYALDSKVPLMAVDVGEYLLIVRASLKEAGVFTFARTGLFVLKDLIRLQLIDPGAKITPEVGYENSNSTFVLKFDYAVSGLWDSTQEDADRLNVRVFGRIEGGETPIPIPEQPLKLSSQYPKPYATGHATITAPPIKVPGNYTWNFTLAASGGVMPYSGKVPFTVKPGFEPLVDIPKGHARVTGLGAKGEVEVNIPGIGWTKLTDGMTFPIEGTGGIYKQVEVQTEQDGLTIEFPDKSKIVMDRHTKIHLNATGSGAWRIQHGQIRVYRPGKPVKSFPNIWKYETPAADFEELGTIFSIAHDSATNVTVIEVEEGEVLVTPKNTNFPPVTLHAGDRLEVSPDKVGSITTGSGKSEGGGEFGERILKVFRSNNISDDTAFDAFAALSLLVAGRNLPASCYDNDPNISNPTWNGHRQWSRENGREKSGKNALWKTGKALACLTNQIEKDRLIAEISQVLAQAEAGNVAGIADLPSPPVQGSGTLPGPGSGNWTDWFDYDDPEGNSDWEAFDMHKANVPCPSPSAVECRTKDGRDWKAARQKMKCSMEEPNPGGICNNVDNAPSGCLDYEVRFSCGGAVPAGAPPGGPPSPPVPSAGQQPAGGTVPAASGQPQDMGAQILAGKVFQVFRSPTIPDPVTLDAFAAISLHIAQYRLPNSCFAEDPYVNVGTWDGHRAWSQQQGREVSARNIVWKTTAARACLNEQQKADLFNQVWWILDQAEKGSVTRLPDLPPPGQAWAPAAGTGAGPTMVWPPPQPANPTPPAVTGTYQPPYTYPTQPQTNAPIFGTPPPMQQQPVYPPPPAINQGPVNSGVPSTAGGNEFFENNTNRYGGDYHNFELTGTDPGPCASACYQDSRCHAWTFVRAGYPDPNPHCWLKNQIPNPTANECCISGTVPLEVQAIIDRRPPAEGAEPSPETGWTGWLNRDSPNASADWESLAELRSSVPCEKPVAIQCRVIGTGQDWSAAGQKYKCSLDEPDPGGICINADNPPNGCLDYEVRFRC